MVGIAFPYAWRDEFGDEPLSFVFLREPTPRDPEKPWRLVTAIPFVLEGEVPPAELSEPEGPLRIFTRSRLCDRLGHLYWPAKPFVEPGTTLSLVDGCEISLRKRHPELLTAFLHVAGHQLGVAVESRPPVDEFIRDYFREDWEKDFPVARCYDVIPERVSYWSKAFGV